MQNENRPVIALIMAGGAGTRFWPLSTETHPKQFLRLIDEHSMLQKTVQRLRPIINDEFFYVLTNVDHMQEVKRQVPFLSETQIIGEPSARDTAPAIALAVHLLYKTHPDAILLIIPSDHYIEPPEDFQQLLIHGCELAASNHRVTIGIRPDYPATEYGYLQKEKPEIKEKDDIGTQDYLTIKRFVEKPTYNTACKYLESNQYLWNGGIYIWKLSQLADDLTRFVPEIYTAYSSLPDYSPTPEWFKQTQYLMNTLPKISIDYALMEQIQPLVALEWKGRWSDLGGWLALQDFLPQDAYKNHYKGMYYQTDCNNNLIIADSPKQPILLAGIQDTIVVSTLHGCLVCKKENIHTIKALVQSLMDSYTSNG